MDAGWSILAVRLGAAVLAGIGLILSGLSISGTWLVVAAAALLAGAGGDGFPGWGTPLAFALIALLVEGVETAAGWLGVTRRGGSAWTGA
ncbi:MAG: DUF456 domain-containing protein, partial [Lentisphaerae bacterium]|nr:DUF456 domain-containing protein [Lentisphaerota bacterium]